MAIERFTKTYDGPGGPFEGVIAYDTANSDPRPGVLVIPNILGQKESDNQKAEDLARLGYVGFAIDVFGQGKRTVRGAPDVSKYMDEMNADRARIIEHHALNTAFVALRFTEMTFGVNFRPHLQTTAFILLRTEHHDTTRISL